ncbi:MAG: hypothetical protein ABJM43_16240 [Paracoccaceae bacterium]
MTRDVINVRRISLRLPASMKNTAEHDARKIAEAMGYRLSENGGQAVSVQIDGHGQSGAQLATRAAMSLPQRGRNGR